jgi:hypothetical protein
LFEKSVGLVSDRFRTNTIGASPTELGDVPPHRRPIELSSYKIQSFDKTRVTSSWVVVFVLHDAKTEIAFVGNVNSVVVKEET